MPIGPRSGMSGSLMWSNMSFGSSAASDLIVSNAFLATYSSASSPFDAT
eukprot:CAMPEP_0204153146 /NCGR_PEP_ID=MMETSP0361-20130328/27602_1 /ASSEMBLY_ACC=CAM_ASM_000343 /TAXON_ID=268821 /ORGANISM="Scrippsiella Hangoei, Strain SHTV-5" /LENGTH=48 /DNA_ID= /DNA_START= /DNA_END= /DNA_ORIENTATION=